ncbi:MAG: hypothetical protein DRN20_06850 [Thermoplasmata archaeon]|nr:MAG: hypothetical protein DRN20_06850 [Thermoplasmata archaeon]
MGVKEIIRRYDKSQVKFTKHAEIRLTQRGFSKEFVINVLFDLDKLVFEEFQEERKVYKLVYNLSRKYNLVIVVTFEKDFIKVVTLYCTSKKIQKIIDKSGGFHIIRKILITKTT